MPISIEIRPDILITTPHGVLQSGSQPTFKTTIRNKTQSEILNKIHANGDVTAFTSNDIKTLISGSAQAAAALQELLRRGILNYELHINELLVAIGTPNSIDISLAWVDRTSTYVIREHTHIRINTSNFSIENPSGNWTISLTEYSENLTNMIKKIKQRPVLYSSISSSSEREALEFLILTDFAIPDSAEQPQRNWEFHDFLFHNYSRSRNDLRMRGATYPIPLLTPPKARYQPKKSSSSSLNLTNIKTPKQSNEFFDILNRRRSSHVKSSNLNLNTLLTIASKSFSVTTEIETSQYTYQLRPFPAAGGLHELDLFCVVSSEIHTSNSLLFFNPIEKKFYPLEASEEIVLSFLEDARKCWGAKIAPRALFIISSRYIRIAWKYESLAYRLTLLNAGSAIQTISLVATTQGVHGCPVGNGNSEAFSRAISESEYEITSIAEYAFG